MNVSRGFGLDRVIWAVKNREKFLIEQLPKKMDTTYIKKTTIEVLDKLQFLKDILGGEKITIEREDIKCPFHPEGQECQLCDGTGKISVLKNTMKMRWLSTLISELEHGSEIIICKPRAKRRRG